MTTPRESQPPLDALLRSGEWNGAEFKAARQGLPKSVFETVSAFANTRGGWLVLGVTQDGERFEVSGVGEPDKLQNDFLSVLHADRKVSHDVDVTEHRYEHDGKVVLAFHIAENPRTWHAVALATFRKKRCDRGLAIKRGFGCSPARGEARPLANPRSWASPPRASLGPVVSATLSATSRKWPREFLREYGALERSAGTSIGHRPPHGRENPSAGTSASGSHRLLLPVHRR